VTIFDEAIRLRQELDDTISQLKHAHAENVYREAVEVDLRRHVELVEADRRDLQRVVDAVPHALVAMRRMNANGCPQTVYDAYAALASAWTNWETGSTLRAPEVSRA